MGVLTLVPASHQQGAASLYQNNAGGIVEEWPTVGAHPDYYVLAGSAGSSENVFNYGGNSGNGSLVLAMNETFNLVVSGTDIPSGRTVTGYRTAIQGYDNASGTTKKPYAQVPSTENPLAYIPGGGTKATHFSPYVTTLNGAVPTKANLLTAGLRVAYPANPTVFYIYQAWMEVTYNDVPLAPSISYPPNGATVNVDNPALRGWANGPWDYTKPQVYQRLRWQFASNSAFTTNLKDYTEGTTMNRNDSGPWQSNLPDALKLSPGVWYFRAAAIDQYGLQGAWTATYSLTVSHPSSGKTVAPAGAGINWNGGNITFDWDFSDSASPLDGQTAYQVQVYANNNTSLIADTGKTASSNTSAVIALPAANSGQELSWRVQTWDEADQSAGYSGYTFFTPKPPPTLVVTGVAVNSPAPEIDWTYTSSGGGTQTLFQVKLTDTGTGALLYASPWIAGSVQTYTVPQPVVANGENVTATVTVQDSDGFTVSATSAYTAAWAVPATQTFSVDITQYGIESAGYVNVTWTNAGQDAQWHSYQVWRRLTGTSTWKMIYETFVNQASYSYKDYLAPSNVASDYAVVQTAVRFGTANASAIPSSPSPVSVTPMSNYYWLIDPNNSANNLMLSHVTDDSLQDNQEQEVLEIIGRGQKTDTGTHFGLTGTITATVYGTALKTAHQIREAIRQFTINGTSLYLRNPFQDVLLINTGNIQMDRIAGVGTNEYFTVQIPVTQVM